MPIDYLSACQDGAQLHLDIEGGRLVLTVEGYMGDIASADEGDDGVLAVYEADPGWLLERLLIELAEAGTGVDAMLRRFEDDPVARLLPPTQPTNPE
jgi:hypothetical protein